MEPTLRPTLRSTVKSKRSAPESLLFQSILTEEGQPLLTEENAMIQTD